MITLSGISRVLALCASIVLPSAVLAQPAATPPAAAAALTGGVPPAPAAAGPSEYVLGPEDVIEYEVVGTSDRTRARIYTDGTIQTSMGGRLVASGRTPRELSSEIAKALKAGGFYADPVVDVQIVGYASRYVTVLGAVGSPGLVPISRTFHLSEILARVGGIRAEGADYVIVRPVNGPEARYFVDKLASGDAANDPQVAAGDKIFSPQADIFYISGQVQQPGSYPLKTDMTVAQAIAKGGGLTESGSDKKVKVRRGGKLVKLGTDAKVEPGDVITVSERLF